MHDTFSDSLMTTKRTFFTISVVTTIAAAFVFLHRADKVTQASLAALPASNMSGLYGTWLADTGDMFQFRPDGTGRYYDPRAPQLGVNYFEWTCDGSIFTYYYAPRGRIKRFIAHQTGMQTDTYQLVKLTPNELMLSDGTITTRFTSATDTSLDADP